MAHTPLTKEERVWARTWKRTPEMMELMRQKMKDAVENGMYKFYGRNVDTMDDDEVKVFYMEMQNYFADCRRD